MQLNPAWPPNVFVGNKFHDGHHRNQKSLRNEFLTSWAALYSAFSCFHFERSFFQSWGTIFWSWCSAAQAGPCHLQNSNCWLLDLVHGMPPEHLLKIADCWQLFLNQVWLRLLHSHVEKSLQQMGLKTECWEVHKGTRAPCLLIHSHSLVVPCLELVYGHQFPDHLFLCYILDPPDLELAPNCPQILIL